jgi:hypothetical protein
MEITGADSNEVHTLGAFSHADLDSLLLARIQFSSGELRLRSGLFIYWLEPGKSYTDQETSSNL